MANDDWFLFYLLKQDEKWTEQRKKENERAEEEAVMKRAEFLGDKTIYEDWLKDKAEEKEAEASASKTAAIVTLVIVGLIIFGLLIGFILSM